MSTTQQYITGVWRVILGREYCVLKEQLDHVHVSTVLKYRDPIIDPLSSIWLHAVQR